nr:MAG TPA: hypothetical protein [Caudoviricetes sp.]
MIFKIILWVREKAPEWRFFAILFPHRNRSIRHIFFSSDRVLDFEDTEPD